MAISERGSGEHGYALLISAAPVSRYRVLDAAGALHQLAAVPPATLLGTATASVVQLTDPVEPNTVLTHLRTAAAAPGPLVIYVAGQLTADRRQHLPHLALARTSPVTVRYTALPWHWLAHELRGRAPGSTTVLADLVAADAGTWARLAADPRQLADGLPLYGTLAPPPPKRATAVPHYSRALAEILRSVPARPPIGRLHAQAAAQAGIGSRGEVLLGGATDEPAGPAAAPPAPAAPVPADAPRPARGPMRDEWRDPARPLPGHAGTTAGPGYGTAPAAPSPGAAAGRGVVPGGGAVPAQGGVPGRPGVPVRGEVAGQGEVPGLAGVPAQGGPSQRGGAPDVQGAASGHGEVAVPGSVPARGTAPGPGMGTRQEDMAAPRGGEPARAPGVPGPVAASAPPAASSGPASGDSGLPSQASPAPLPASAPTAAAAPSPAGSSPESGAAPGASAPGSAPAAASGLPAGADPATAGPVPGPEPAGTPRSSAPAPAALPAEPTSAPAPESSAVAPRTPDAPAASGPASAPVQPPAPASGAPAAAPAAWPPVPSAPPRTGAEAAPASDPYAAIRAAARAGRHTEAAAIAAAWEAAALRASGPTSPEALHWVEVRADLAMLAGDTARACALWMTAAGARLSRGQGADDEAVIGLVDRAHHCWVRITDVSAAQNLSADLLRLREAVPGRRPGALDQLRRRVAALQGQRGVSAP